ncbi:MAG: ATP-binding protein, partial [Acidimicrobiales bacterium]
AEPARGDPAPAPPARGGPAAEGRSGLVELDLDREGGELVVRVRDNGHGLPEGFSIEATRSLGLSIVRLLVTEQLQGTIAMSDGAGTVVELRLPVGEPVPR